MTSRRGAFTLIELLVVVAIIAILAAMLLPVLSRAREQAGIASEIGNIRQVATAYLMYADDADGWYPRGWRDSWGFDDIAWFRYATWVTLRDQYGLTPPMMYCQCYRDSAAGFCQPMATLPNDTNLGLDVWVGRQDLYAPAGSATVYASPQRVGKDPQNSSATLATCFHYNSNGNGWGSSIPHVRGLTYTMYPSGAAISPPPRGMVVAHLDASSGFYLWQEFAAAQHQGFTGIVYYHNQ